MTAGAAWQRLRAATLAGPRTAEAITVTSPVPPRWRPALLALMFAVSVALAATQVSLGRADLPITWLVVVPMLASLTLSLPAVWLCSAAAMVLAGLVEFLTPGRGVSEWARLSVLLLLCAFAILNAVLRQLATRRLERIRNVAAVAQSALLHEVPAVTVRAEFAARYISASEEARVGGDLLDVLDLGDRTRWIVGDTKGKGLPAVRLASATLHAFREVARRPGADLVEVALTVDATVRREAGDEDFVTAVFCELGPAGWLQLVSCGHPPPLLMTASGHRLLSPRDYAAPLGLLAGAAIQSYRIDAGDRVLFYTDGLLECRDGAGEFFRLEDHLGAMRAATTVEQLVDQLLSSLRGHAGRRLQDDVALLAVEARAAATAATQPSAPPSTAALGGTSQRG